jgi:hypothetical protein
VAVLAVAVEPGPALEAEPTKSQPRPKVLPPRPDSPKAPDVIEEDPLAQALLDTPPPVGVAPVADKPREAGGQAAERAAEPASPEQKPAPAGLGQTLPLSAVKSSSAIAPAKSMPQAKRDGPKSDESTQPPRALPRPARSKVPLKAAAKAPPAPVEGGGWLRTGVFAVLAAGASYYGVTMVSSLLSGPKPPAASAAAAAESAAVAPLPVPVISAAPTPAKLQFTTTQTPLPAGSDVPSGDGLLEIKVPEGTAIRVDGEYLGMGPGRRVPLKPGPHELTLGDGTPPATVTITAGERTLASSIPSLTSPAGSP